MGTRSEEDFRGYPIRVLTAYIPRSQGLSSGGLEAPGLFWKDVGHLGQCGFCTRGVRKSIHIPCIGHAYFTHIACTWHAYSPCITSIFRAYSIHIPYMFLVIPCIFRSYPMQLSICIQCIYRAHSFIVHAYPTHVLWIFHADSIHILYMFHVFLMRIFWHIIFIFYAYSIHSPCMFQA